MYVWPLVGRAVDGVLMSDYIGTLKVVRVINAGSSLDVTGTDPRGDSVRISFDPKRDLLATEWEKSSDGFVYRWKVSASEPVPIGDNRVFMPISARIEVGRAGPDLQQIDINLSKYGSLPAKPYSPPMTVGSLIVNRDEQTIYRANADGNLSYYERLGARRRTPFPLGLVFVASSTVTLLVSLGFLARSRRSSSGALR